MLHHLKIWTIAEIMRLLKTPIDDHNFDYSNEYGIAKGLQSEKIALRYLRFIAPEYKLLWTHNTEVDRVLGIDILRLEEINENKSRIESIYSVKSCEKAALRERQERAPMYITASGVNEAKAFKVFVMYPTAENICRIL